MQDCENTDHTLGDMTWMRGSGLIAFYSPVFVHY